MNKNKGLKPSVLLQEDQLLRWMPLNHSFFFHFNPYLICLYIHLLSSVYYEIWKKDSGWKLVDNQERNKYKVHRIQIICCTNFKPTLPHGCLCFPVYRLQMLRCAPYILLIWNLSFRLVFLWTFYSLRKTPMVSCCLSTRTNSNDHKENV